MPPLVLVPCTSSKSLPVADGLRGRELHVLASDEQASTWRSRVAEARPRVPVRSLYKGGAWTLAREAAAVATRRGGAAWVVSAGLGLISLDSLAPGYDLTFTAGNPNIIPGGASPEARAIWWRGLAGPAALHHARTSGPYRALLVALPGAYLDAIAPSLAEVVGAFGSDRVSVLSSRLSRFSRQYLSECWVPVTADQTTTLRGNAGQSALSALLYALQTLPADVPITRPALAELLGQLARRTAPLYPRRERMGRAHAVAWIDNAIASGRPPISASEALRRYRDGGFAYEQKAFHVLFKEVAEKA
jgi:hypothetical protein